MNVKEISAKTNSFIAMQKGHIKVYVAHMQR